MASSFTLKLLPLYRAIDPLFDIDTETRFRKIYGSDGRRGSDILRHRLGFMSLLVTKDKLKLQAPIIETIKIKTKDSDKYLLSNVKTEMKSFVEKQVQYYRSTQEQDKKFFFDCVNIYRSSIKARDAIVELEKYLSYIEMIRKTSPFELINIKQELKFCNWFEKNKIIPSLQNRDQRIRFLEVKTLYKYMILKVQGECLGQILGKRRTECYKSMVEFIDFESVINSTTKKTVIFTSFVEVLEEAKKVISTLGYNPLVVYGQTNNELAQIVSRFEKEDNINPLIATFKSLSTAVPLVMADTVIMIDPPFREYILTQAISRVHRLGATTQTYIYMTELDTGDQPNLSNRTLDILKWSQEEVSNILGVPSTYNLEEAEYSQTLVMEDVHSVKLNTGPKSDWMIW